MLHIIATLDPAGSEGQLTRLCLGLDRRKFAPAVCCLTRGGSHEAELRAAGVTTAVLGKRGRYDLATLCGLRRELTRLRPQIVQTWLFTANTWGRTAAWLGGVPIVIGTERAADIWKSAAHRWIDRRLARFSNVILVNAEAVARFYCERIGIPRRKVRVIRNGLDLARFDEASSRQPDDTPPRTARLLLGAVARLEEQKGLIYLIGAMGRLMKANLDAELWVVGDGPQRPVLEQIVRRSRQLRGRVRFLGRRRDVPALMKRFDIFVLPSLWEGLPNAVIEAMAARLPVVATNVDGTPELVRDGDTGLLVPACSAEGLAGAVGRLASDRARREAMGWAGRKRVEQDFSEARMVAETEQLYLELAHKAGIA